MSESEPQVQQQGSGDGKAVIAEAVATPRIIPSYTRIIGDKGPEDSPFVIIGEAPGKQEVMQGAPFVGPSGFILDHALSQFPKGSFPEPYVMNAVPHKIGGDKDQDLLKKYARDNWERVREIIGKHPRKVVLALGAVANMCVLNDLNLKITRVRGTRFPYDLSEHALLLLCTQHFFFVGEAASVSSKPMSHMQCRLLPVGSRTSSSHRRGNSLIRQRRCFGWQIGSIN